MTNVESLPGCIDFPCVDVHHDCYLLPQFRGADLEVAGQLGSPGRRPAFRLDPQEVKLVMISEATPLDPDDYYYADGDPLFQQTTVLAFQDAGIEVDSIQDILDQGVYLTSAIKCAKQGYVIKAGTIVHCSHILERELAQFPNAQIYLLMGDAAIKAINTIARRHSMGRVIPPGSTYKIRGREYTFKDVRLFPSYLQAGPAFFIEKSKRKMIAEDIRNALALI